MTISEAMEILATSTRYDACKRPAMGGYIWRDGAVSTETATEGDWTMKFRKRANVSSQPVDYAFTYDADGTGASKWSTSDTLPLTGELLEELSANDWQTGTKADFENARTGVNGGDW